jgi:hypothetical protein
MPTVKAKKTVKTAVKKTSQKPVKKTAKKITQADVWAGFDRIDKILAKSEEERKEAEKAREKERKETEKEREKEREERKEAEKAREKEREKEREEAEKKHQKALDEIEKILGRLGNRQGEIAESTLVPDLPEKFKKYGFSFGVISRNRKMHDAEHDIHTEVDAFLENSVQAMAVEVKVTLRPEDVNSHAERMQKVRRYADLHGDTRQFYGAMAAMVVAENVKTHALNQGFYVIEPAGEDVKITAPFTEAKVW